MKLLNPTEESVYSNMGDVLDFFRQQKYKHVLSIGVDNFYISYISSNDNSQVRFFPVTARDGYYSMIS